jgi:hypothetical protein
MEQGETFEKVVAGMLFRFSEFYESGQLRYTITMPNRNDVAEFVVYLNSDDVWNIEHPERIPEEIAAMARPLGYAIESYNA